MFKELLASAVGLDYSRLHRLLLEGQWEAADQETRKLMLTAADREQDGWLDRKSLQNFPCTDLYTIDQLWLKFSQKRFGFSTQQHIWDNIINNPNTPQKTSLNQRTSDKIEQFGELLGLRFNGNWLKINELTFDISAPQGHLPSTLFAVPCGDDEPPVIGRWCSACCVGELFCGTLWAWGISDLASKMSSCGWQMNAEVKLCTTKAATSETV
ncbi:MAG: GUN4 domain-containing protein [Symploca sp. SIO1A3]|nr:GUN4 domain-containing protein [Symploca sp. SIO1A3]